MVLYIYRGESACGPTHGSVVVNYIEGREKVVRLAAL